ncbi:MAG: hypothetical protein ABI831_11135 [Betaproteobacteria bacterium]
MSVRGIALAGATSRLLPASIPFRFFGAAVVFHALAWIALLADVPRLPRAAGGLGWPLAALHLVTLGVLVMTAIGASLQLLPVATRQPVRAQGWACAVWWIYTPGVAALALGMGLVAPWLLALGAVAVIAALAIYAALLARNLHGARGMPVVVAHGWAAAGALVVVLATALALVSNWLGAPLLDRSTATALHLAFGVFGFMGLLAMGLSHILIPLFALAPAPAGRPAQVSLIMALLALLCAAVAAFGIAPMAWRVAAIVLFAAAFALHLRAMLQALREGMRRAPSPSFRLVRVSWAMLAIGVIPALLITLGQAPAGVATPFGIPGQASAGATTLFGLLVIIGWLLTFLLGIMQRIVPFLASMHTTRRGGRSRTPSSLTAERPLAIHFGCHLAALALLVAAILADSPLLGAIGAATGATGAVAFACFFASVLLRMTRTTAVESAPALRLY